MIRLAARQHPSASLPLRRLSSGNDHARHRAALDNRLVDQSSLRDAGSAYRYRPNEPKEAINAPRNKPPASKSP
jgi:hypothetical protein